MELNGYDAWKTRAPEMPSSNGKPERFACLDCEWRGKGYTARADHYLRTAHRVVFGSDPRVSK